MKTVSQLEKELKEAKEEQKNAWVSRAGVDCFVNGDQIFFTSLNSEDEVIKVLNAFEPYETSHIQKYGGKNIYISSPYKVSLSNDFSESKLKISFKMINSVEILCWINVNLLSEEFKNNFLSVGTRSLSDTEEIHVMCKSHTREFKNYRVRSYGFKNFETLNFYKEHKQLSNSEQIKEVINYFIKF